MGDPRAVCEASTISMNELLVIRDGLIWMKAKWFERGALIDGVKRAIEEIGGDEPTGCGRWPLFSPKTPDWWGEEVSCVEFDVEDLFPAIVDETATATVEPAMDTSNLVTHEPQPACATGDARDEIEQDLVVAGQSEAARVEDGATSYHDGAAGIQEHDPEEDHQGQGEGPGLAQTVQR